MKYFYRDFMTDKIRWTAGKFSGWTQPTGLLNARYAIFARRSDVLLIPIYALTHASRANLPNPESGMMYLPMIEAKG